MMTAANMYLESTKNAFRLVHCSECSKEALGRCPDCHKRFCQDHFPKQQHTPCVEKQAELAPLQICYVCNEQVYPKQWSLSKTTHFIDQTRCAGCKRYVCDEKHTKKKGTSPKIILDGMQSHRYEYVERYCGICAPLSAFGGLRGLGYWIAGLTTAGLLSFYLLHH
jgi:hypothetical protein